MTTRTCALRAKRLMPGAVAASLLSTLAAHAQEQAKPATEATKAANAKLINELPFTDKTAFDQPTRASSLRCRRTCQGRERQPIWDPQQVRLHQGRPGRAGHGQPQPLAPIPAHRHLGPVQGRGRHLPGSRLRPVEHDHRRGQHGHHRHRPADLDRDRQGGAGPVLPAPPKKPVVAVIYTHSHVDHFGGVRGVVDEADVKAGKVKIYAPDGLPRRGRERERDGRHRHEPPRQLHVRQPAAAQRRPGQIGAGPGHHDLRRHGDADPADRHHRKTGEKLTHRRPDLRVPVRAGQRGAGGDALLHPGEEGPQHGRGLPPTPCTTSTRYAAPRCATR